MKRIEHDPQHMGSGIGNRLTAAQERAELARIIEQAEHKGKR